MRLSEPRNKVETVPLSNADSLTLNVPILALALNFTIPVQGFAQALEPFTYIVEDV